MNTLLPAQAINEYKELLKKHFGEDLSFEEAQIKAEEFIKFFSVIHKPIKKAWLNKKQQNQKK